MPDERVDAGASVEKYEKVDARPGAPRSGPQDRVSLPDVKGPVGRRELGDDPRP